MIRMPQQQPGQGHERKTGQSQRFRLEALTEVNGQPYTTMAEFNLIDATGATVSRTGWQVSADSAESDAPASNAIDGTPLVWHTQWRTASPPPPHAFTVNLGANVQIGGFRYLPRQDANDTGQIANWNFYVSQDGVTWTLVTQGTFANTKTEKTVTFTTGNRPPAGPRRDDPADTDCRV